MHWPLLRVVLGAVASFALVALAHARDLDVPVPAAWWIFFFLGLAYTQLFEYGFHRYGMHRGRGVLLRSHLRHHRIFHGEHFASRNAAELEHVAGRWYLFPLGLLAHFLIARLVVPPGTALALLAGCVSHYVLFETSHFLAHVEDHPFDRWIRRIPLLGSLRDYQIAHHRLHHELPRCNFNFNPPFLGDGVCGTLSPSLAGDETPQMRMHPTR